MLLHFVLIQNIFHTFSLYMLPFVLFYYFTKYANPEANSTIDVI